MSYRMIKRLQLTAMILEAIAFLWMTVAILFQRQLKSWLYDGPREIIEAFTVPVNLLVSGLLAFSLAVLFFVFVCKNRYASASKKLVIALIVVKCAISAAFQIGSFLYTMILSRYDQFQLASYSEMEFFITIVASPFSNVSSILMLVAMGGYYGKARENVPAAYKSV